MADPLEFMWNEQILGERTWPFFLWVPVERLTGETIWRLWLLSGWTNQFASTKP